MSNSFQNFSANNVQNSSGAHLTYKYHSTFKTKDYITSRNFLQNIPYHKSDNKLIQKTKNISRYKKCEKIPKLQHMVKQNQQVLLHEMPNNLTESSYHNDGENTAGDSTLCNDDKLHNEYGNEVHNKDNKKEEKLGENIEDYVNGGARESREKTPMCLVNDLARFNKISFQYHLTGEHGPAHCKRFTVTLKLGDEEYSAEAFKIKKAQHLAAKEAIQKTKYKHPLPKTNRRNENEVTKINITPTVELNALAMKLGQQTYYILDPLQTFSPGNNITSETSQVSQLILYNNFNQNRQSFDKCENRYLALKNFLESSNFSPCKITLIVGNQKFFGIGKSLQQAKHDAAKNALQVLKNQINRNKTENLIENFNENEHKSPISLVFEIGIKRNFPVDFKVLREEGPAHMRTFTTACIVGNIVTEGKGTGKKLSKKKAAQRMLEELNKLPPLSSDTSPIKRTKNKASKKSEGLSINSDTDWKRTKKKNNAENDSSSPVTKVLEWHQNNNEKEPVFKLISESEKVHLKRRQFVMELSTNKINVRGIGNSKKLAKRDAAQNFLNVVNRNNGVYSSKNENLSSMQLQCTSDEIFTIMEQVKPNHCSDNIKVVTNRKDFLNVVNRNNGVYSSKNENLSSMQLQCTSDEIFTIMEQVKPNHCSDNIKVVTNRKEQNMDEITPHSTEKCLDTVTNKKISKPLKQRDAIYKSPGLHMKDQLMYLANLLGFKVDFSDYPKGNHNEFLTIVMLSTNPPQISHGVGINSKESQEDASRNALKILSEMGLSNAAKS